VIISLQDFSWGIKKGGLFMTKIKRTLAWLLAAAMLATAAPINALAANDEDVETSSPSAQTTEPTQTIEPKDESYGGNEAYEFGDDAFLVSLEETAEADQYKLSNIGLEINGVFIPAVEVTDEKTEGIQPYSLLPLEEHKNFKLDLSQVVLFPSEIRNMKISYVLDQTTGNDTKPDASKIAVWGKYYSYNGSNTAEFHPMQNGDTLDLSPISYSNRFTLELIVGTSDQLDPDNVRYVIDCYVPTESMPLAGDIKNTGVTVSSKNYYPNSYYYIEDDETENTTRNRINRYEFTIDKNTWNGKDPLSVTFDFDSTLPYAQRKNDVNMAFYAGYFETAAETAGKSNITSQIYGASAPGYLISERTSNGDPVTAVITDKTGVALAVIPFYINLYRITDYIDLDDNLYDENSNEAATYTNYKRDENTNYLINVYRVNSIHNSVNDRYFAKAKYYVNGNSQEGVSSNQIRDYVTRAVEGYYTSAAEIDVQPNDITDQLFGEKGFQADYSGQGKFFTVLCKDNTIRHLGLVVENLITGEIELDYDLYDDEGRAVAGRQSIEDENGCTTYTYIMRNKDDDISANYCAKVTYQLNGYNGPEVSPSQIRDYISRTVEGYCTSTADVNRLPDITDTFFSAKGYPADYSGAGKTFTIATNSGDLLYVKIVLTPSDETYFRMNTPVYKLNDDAKIERLYETYKVDDSNDSMANIYQTLFILERDGKYNSDSQSYPEKAVDAATTKIYPSFRTDAKRIAILGVDGVTQGDQISEKSSIPFGGASGIGSGKALQYTAFADNNRVLQNYWVTFLTQQKNKAQLFVVGENVIDDEYQKPHRKIHLDEADSYYDILFANIGDQQLTDLYVKLENENDPMLKLDDYWTIKSNGKKSLAPFNSTYKGVTTGGTDVRNGELPNVAKVRLIPKLDENGEPVTGIVNNTLIIGSTATNEKVEIKITGTTGKLKITTETLPEGVKFVPYASAIQTNAIEDELEFTVTGDPLPSPLAVNPDTGEIYDVPLVAGEAHFTVSVRYRDLPNSPAATKDFTLKILENTDENVWNSTDDNYQLTRYVGTQDPDNSYHFTWTDDDGNGVLESHGELEEFIDLYLDGERLIRGVEYTVERGSTRATIQPQVLSKKGSGSHTLSAEFNKSKVKQGTNMKKASQNYYYSPKNNNNNNNNSSSRRRRKSSGGSGGASSSAPVNTPTNVPNNETPSNSTSTPMTFTDIPKNSWYHDDIQWVFDSKIMQGVNEQTFAPDSAISQGTIVLTLARMAKVDLDKFKNMSVEGIPSGQWYTEAAIWARQSGLTKDPNKFTGSDVLTRDEMAVMLVKFLRSLQKNAAAPDQPVTFADAADMSEQGKEAFQILYKMGVFKGVGNNRMDPNGTTTRAQFAALLHRLSDTVLSK